MSRLRNVLWLALALACGSALAAEEIRWAPDIQTARKAATQFNVPLLIHFYGDNCLPCRTLEDRVYSKRECIDTLNKFFICVRVNATQERQTAAEYQVHSWPTDVFVSPDGKTLFQGVCAQDLNGYLSSLQNVAVMNRDRNVMLAAQRPAAPVANAAATNVAANTRPNANLQSGPYQQAASQQPASQQSLGRQAATAQNTSAQNAAVQGVALGYPAGHDYSASRAAATYGDPAFAEQAEVATGPLTAAQQPTATTGAVQGQQQQLAGAVGPAPRTTTAADPTTGTAAGPFPALNQAALNRSPAVGHQTGASALAGMSGMPTMKPTAGPDATASQATARPNVFSTASSTAGTVKAQLVGNPYYPASQNTQVTPTEAEPTDVPEQQETASPARENPLLVPALEQSTPAQPTFQPRRAEGPAIAATTTATATTSEMPSRDDRAPEKATEKSVTTEAAGLGGYCPVALKSDGQWVQGDENFAVKHRGKIYWLSSQEARIEFLADPDASSPVLAGYDPLVFLEEGRLVEGSIEYGLHEQVSGAYLLFATQDAKKKYWDDFDRYTRALDALLEQAGVR